MGELNAEGEWAGKPPENEPRDNQHNPRCAYWAPVTRHRPHKEHRGRGRQKAATRRHIRREERVTVQGPVKKLQPDGLSHTGGGGGRVGCGRGWAFSVRVTLRALWRPVLRGRLCCGCGGQRRAGGGGGGRECIPVDCVVM